MSFVGLKNNGPIISVDDDELFHVLMRIAHKKSGCCNHLIIFDNGSKCLTYLREVIDGTAHHPSIILLDVNMPGMNGFETLIKIREFSSFKSKPPICLLSAAIEDTDIHTALSLGADDFWEKPTNLASIPVFSQFTESQ